MSAQKKVVFRNSDLLMLPQCHPSNKMEIRYRPARGGDEIVVKCEVCYREYFVIKLPKEDK